MTKTGRVAAITNALVKFFAINTKLPIVAMLALKVFTRKEKKLPPDGKLSSLYFR